LYFITIFIIVGAQIAEKEVWPFVIYFWWNGHRIFNSWHSPHPLNTIHTARHEVDTPVGLAQPS